MKVFNPHKPILSILYTISALVLTALACGFNIPAETLEPEEYQPEFFEDEASNELRREILADLIERERECRIEVEQNGGCINTDECSHILGNAAPGLFPHCDGFDPGGEASSDCPSLTPEECSNAGTHEWEVAVHDCALPPDPITGELSFDPDTSSATLANSQLEHTSANTYNYPAGELTFFSDGFTIDGIDCSSTYIRLE